MTYELLGYFSYYLVQARHKYKVRDNNHVDCIDLKRRYTDFFV
jgi:hypothetical protein